MKKWFQTHGTTISLAILTALMFLVTQPSDAPEVLATCLLILICGGVILLLAFAFSTPSQVMATVKAPILIEGSEVNHGGGCRKS